MSLTCHQRGIILRGITRGAALRGKNARIGEQNTLITCNGKLTLWDICSITTDAEAFQMQVAFHYDGKTIITFKD